MSQSAAQPPYALATPAFRRRALAALAARAPIGPAREVALAWFVSARLLDGAMGPGRLSGATCVARAAAARTWLASAGLPSGCRLPLSRVIDACGTEREPDRQRIAKVVADALRATAEHLDPASRAELDAFGRS